MKLRLIIFFIVITLLSCKDKINQAYSYNLKKEADVVESFENIKSDTIENECDEYWKLRTPNDSIKINYINELLYKSNEVPTTNKDFLIQLQINLKISRTNRASKLKIEQILFPVFKLKEEEMGIFSFPVYNYDNNNFEDISIENKLIRGRTDFYEGDSMENFGKLIYYQNILDSIYPNDKPSIYIFSKNGVRQSQVINFGMYLDECLEYYNYSIDKSNIKPNDDILLGSRLNLELIYENNADIDSLVKRQIKKECYDCPNSFDLQKTFARVKGFGNLFFLYADTFPLNNQLDTPSRSLVLKTNKNTIVYLWYEEVDLFGCSCL